MTPRVLCLLAVLPLLAGCVDTCNPVPPVSARGVGPSTPSSGGDGGYLATLTVQQEPGGPGLAGAGVVFFWGHEDAAAAQRGDRPVVHVGAQGGSGSASVDVSAPSVAPPTYTTTLPLRADANGRVTAKLPTDRIVGVVAAADGWTEEWIPALATGSTGDLSLQLPLYHEKLTVDLDGTIGPAGGSSATLLGNRQAQWYPQDVRLGTADGATSGYLARAIGFEATLNWTNQPSGFGDLALAAGPDPGMGQATVVRDDSNDVATGPRTQGMTLDGAGLEQARLNTAAHLQLGPATRTLFVAPAGSLPYHLHVTLTMDREQAFRQECGASVSVNAESHSAPAAGLLAAVGLLGAAAVARRRE